MPCSILLMSCRTTSSAHRGRRFHMAGVRPDSPGALGPARRLIARPSSSSEISSVTVHTSPPGHFPPPTFPSGHCCELSCKKASLGLHDLLWV